MLFLVLSVGVSVCVFVCGMCIFKAFLYEAVVMVSVIWFCLIGSYILVLLLGKINVKTYDKALIKLKFIKYMKLL